MGQNSSIEWTHHTFNPWRGCSKVSPGCAHCYAEREANRRGPSFGIWGDAGTRVIASDAYWRQPLLWNKRAAAAGQRHRVFCASLADVFEDRPELAAPRARLYELICQTPHLDWLLLTKRPQHAQRLWSGANVDAFDGSESVGPVWQRNVWLGTSVENQAAADDRVEHLVRVPAAVRFLSCEPLLGPINLNWIGCEYQGADAFDGVIDALRGETWVEDWCDSEGKKRERRVTGACGRIHWVIAGGESGPHARPMHPDWARSLRDQCAAAGVPFFFLDAREHNDLPAVSTR